MPSSLGIQDHLCIVALTHVCCSSASAVSKSILKAPRHSPMSATSFSSLLQPPRRPRIRYPSSLASASPSPHVLRQLTKSKLYSDSCINQSKIRSPTKSKEGGPEVWREREREGRGLIRLRMEVGLNTKTWVRIKPYARYSSWAYQ